MNCQLCPRQCGVDRAAGQVGYCRMGATIMAARAALHFWEEPCISGIGGSGTVFFSGCNLRCFYCQNHEISTAGKGYPVTPQRLREIFYELIEQGAENINLVTPTHFVPQIAEALREKLPVPVIYNCGGYESVETLRLLDGLVDIYLPDMKYSDASLAARLSAAPDYPEVAERAIAEMFRQTGGQVYDGRGRLLSGVQVRHLVLPGFLENTYGVLDWFSSRYRKAGVGFSLMSQFTPTPACQSEPTLRRRLNPEEYERAVDYMYLCGITTGFVQELSSANEEYIPAFNGMGILPIRRIK